MADSTRTGELRPSYEPPKLTVMSESDLLKAFQVTSAASSWWSM